MPESEGLSGTTAAPSEGSNGDADFGTATASSKSLLLGGFTQLVLDRCLANCGSSKTDEHELVVYRPDDARPNLSGIWICIDTWGQDAFLRACGASRSRRKAAQSAPWPTWEIRQQDNTFAITNFSSIGDAHEEFQATGAEYVMANGLGQLLRSRAFWSGQVLVVERLTSRGGWREERRISHGGNLEFKLATLGDTTGLCWGRTFERKGGTFERTKAVS